MPKSTLKEGIWEDDHSVCFEWRNRITETESGQVFDLKFDEIKSLGKDDKIQILFKYSSIYQFLHQLKKWNTLFKRLIILTS